MRQIVRRIMLTKEAIPQWSDVIKSKGSLDVIEILNSYPAFVEAVKNFKKDPRGRKTDNPTLIELEFLTSIIMELYAQRGQKAPRKDSVRGSLNGMMRDVDFFDPVRSRYWIDMFSALDYKLHIFASDDNCSFSTFFTNYVSLYSKLNKMKTVPFYARWIREIAAMYTIYLNETSEEFERMATMFQVALEQGVANKSKKRLSRYETDYVRNYMMTNIFMAYEKDKDAVISKLCDYITNNPDEFVYERHIQLDKRYRRYYCVIKDMLHWIVDNDKSYFDNDKLIAVFCQDNVDYAQKDANIHILESVLAKKMIDMYKKAPDDVLNESQVAECLSFLVSEPETFRGKCKDKVEDKWREYSKTYQLVFSQESIPEDKIFKDEIVFEVLGENEGQLIKREHEIVVDSVVKLLRLSIMVISIYQAVTDESNEYAELSREAVISTINQSMKRFGLLSLPMHTIISYNEKSLMDFCVVDCINYLFEED